MSAGADYAIGAMVSRDAAVAAFSRAYGLPADRIAFLPDSMHPWPDADVILDMTGDAPIPGDYPIQIVTWDSDERSPRVIATSLAIALRSPVLIGADTYDPQDMELHLPDGTVHRVTVMQDEDDGFRNTPEMHALIATAHSRTAQARAA
ncbi:MAG: hypothetical protein ACTHMX_17145 [Thermomicrobiales bacterium]